VQVTLADVLTALQALAKGAPDEAFAAHVARIQAGGAALAEDLARQLTAVHEALRDSALAERGLGLLIETTHDLSSTLALHDLLKTIVRRARSLVGANVAWVTILDDDSGLFRTVWAEGHLTPETAEMTSRVETGAVSLIMTSKSYFETQDYLADTRFRHSPELDRIFARETIKSLAGFPILSEEKVQGFLFVADRYSRRLSGRELSVLGSFALHAGVALRNADAFRQLSGALDEAERNRTALIEHIRRVEASAEAHDEMAALLASGAELGLFLNRMASRVNGAVFLMDDQFTIREEFVAPSYLGGLAAKIRAGQLDPALLITANTRSRQSGKSSALDARDGEQVRVVALHAGAGRGDSLVICHPEGLDAIEIRNLERSAVALAIAKLWNERRKAEKSIASSTLLRHLVLVSPPDLATISAIRDRLGLHPDTPVMLALAAATGDDRLAQTAHIRDCAAEADLLVDLLEDSYLAFGPVPAIRLFLHNLTRPGAARWRAGGILSDQFTDLAEAPAEFARISRAIRVLQAIRPLDRFVGQTEVNLFAKLFEVGDAGRLGHYLADLLAPLERLSPRQHPALKATLLAHFDNQHSHARTAETLGLHVNTVRQRLDTLRAALGPWDDPLRAQELHLALRLDRILGARRE
jgi:hypothetical protein